MTQASAQRALRQPRPSRRHPSSREETDLDALSLLRLQIEWGADEALQDEPIDRLQPVPGIVQSLIPPPAPVRRLDRSAPPPAAVSSGAATRGQVAAAQAVAAEAQDIASLRAAVATFDGCSLRDTATSLVFAEGDPGSGLMIVGEVPDAEEDRSGHPFAGRAGQLLDRMLESVGLDRQRLLLAPLVPWRPPGDRPPGEFQLSICLPFLQRLLVLVQPAHLLLMGSGPVKLLAGTPIRAAAGWQRLVVPGLRDDARALAMRHPTYLLSHPAARRDAWSSLLLLRKTLDGQPSIPSEPPEGGARE